MDSPAGFAGLIQLISASTFPMLSLIGLGFLSRKLNLLKSGDERVLSSYLYYFAIPALFVSNLSLIRLDRDSMLLILKSLMPLASLLVILLAASAAFRIKKEHLALLIVSSMFGSSVFFGIPYIIFLFGPGKAENIATLTAVPVSVAGWFVSIIVLEFHSLHADSLARSMAATAKKILKNPLIISMAAGILVSVSGAELPGFLAETLGMLKRSTSVIAMFMLGMFFYGKSYSRPGQAFLLSLPRMAILPAIALLVCSLTGSSGTELSVLVLMHGMPAAVNLVVLSERYDFFRDRIPAFLLVSTFISFLSLAAWFLLIA